MVLYIQNYGMQTINKRSRRKERAYLAARAALVRLLFFF